jgi:hypothetical protein
VSARPTRLAPFVPSGPSFDTALAFFAALGREVHLIDPAGVCWHVRQGG